MFEVLDEKEQEKFVNQFFKGWDNDIWKVSKISYKNIVEYLINEHYIFTVREK